MQYNGICRTVCNALFVNPLWKNSIKEIYQIQKILAMLVNKHNTGYLKDYYPILSCDGDMLISKSGDIAICYEVSMPEFHSMSAAEYEQLLVNMMSAVTLLPENTILHKQDIFYRKEYKATMTQTSSYLSQAFSQHYDSRTYMEHKAYMYLIQTTKRRINSSTRSSSILFGKGNFHTFTSTQVAQFFESAQSFGSYLRDVLHIPCRMIRTQEYPTLMHRYMNLEFGDTLSPLYEDMELLPSKMVIGEKHIINFCISDSAQLSSNLYSRYSNKALSTSSSKIVSSLIGMISGDINCNHIVNQYIYILNSEEIIGKAESLSKLLGSFSSVGRQNAVNKDSIDEFLNECAKHNLTPVKAHYNIFAWGEENEYTNIKQSVVNAFTKSSVTVRSNSVDTASKFFAGIPGSAGDIGSEDMFIVPLDSALCLFLYEGKEKDDKDSNIRLTSRITGIPVGVEMGEKARSSSLIDNFNRFVLGPSGSGKSFFTNHILRQQYDAGDHIFIIDIGRSYYDLMSIINYESGGSNGKYYDYSSDSSFSFNPFSSPDRYTSHTRDFLQSLLLTMWLGEKEATNTQISDVTKLLQHYEESIKDFQSQSFNSFYEYALDYAEDFDNKRDFLKNLEKFYRGGIYEQYFNGDTGVDELLGNRFIVFEIENIKDNAILYPLITLVIMELFVTKMLNQDIKTQKVLLIEEAWKAIANKQMSSYIVWLWKTARKHNAAAMVVTQDIDDIISSPIVKDAIINNSSIKILLDQKNYINNFERISQFLSLTDQDKALALSLNRTHIPGRKYKEVFIKRGSVSQAYAVEVSPAEAVIYNTEKNSKEYLHRLMRDRNIIEAIEYIIRKTND